MLSIQDFYHIVLPLYKSHLALPVREVLGRVMDAVWVMLRIVISLSHPSLFSLSYK